MTPHIKFSSIFQFPKNKEESAFFTSDNCLDYLGENGKTWISTLVNSALLENKATKNDQGFSQYFHASSKVSNSATLLGDIFVAEGAVVEPTAYIQGPCYIGKNSQVRHGAYIRGNVYLGEGSVAGHATEIKGSVLMSGAKAAHFAYVGDAILGQGVNLGAGTKLANLKFSKSNIYYTCPENNKKTDSGLHKFSVVMGDEAQSGCNSVIAPGSILFPKTIVMSCINYCGTLKGGIAR